MKGLVVALGLCLAALAGQRVPVILDTDIGTDIDDAFALALALSSPELELVGITTVSADAYTRARIVCRFLEAVGRADIPVAAGRPQRAQPETTGQYRYALEGTYLKRPVPELAPEFLRNHLAASPGQLTIVTIGDLTNVGVLLTRYPEAAGWVRRLVIMGGSVRVGYSGKPPIDREWNIRSDVKAAQVVFASGVPIVLAPLDATTMVKLEAPWRERIFAVRTALTEQLHALYRLWGKTTPTLFDPVAVTLAFNEEFCRIESLRIEIDEAGYTREVLGKPNARVAVSIRTHEYLEWFTQRVVGFGKSGGS